MADFIDPEELPFTTDEVYRAGQRFLPESDARLMADHLTRCAPDLIATRAARRARWQLAEIPGAEQRFLHGWMYPAELLPALASLSPELTERVEQFHRALGQDGFDVGAA